MDRKELMEMFNRQPRLGSLATSDGKGNVNTAVFSALNMVSEEIVVMAIGENRSLANLRENPKAAFVFFEPAANPMEWKGARLYFNTVKIEREGPLFDQLVAAVRKEVGDEPADHVRAAVTFRIEDVRPLVDSYSQS